MSAATLPISAAQISERLVAIATELRDNAALWRSNAFRNRHLPWEEMYPDLSVSLRALPLEESEFLHRDPVRASAFLARWIPVERCQRLAEVPAWPAQRSVAWPRAFARDVPGRKWQQIGHFIAALSDGGLACMDWCAGKGHLSRALSHALGGREVTVLERDPQLAEQARRLAARERLPLRVRNCDLLACDVLPELREPVQVVALHACGDLHLAMLRGAIRAGVAQLACAPCCYHLGGSEQYRCLSQVAAATGLALSRAELRTAVQQTVTAPGHARAQRRRLQQWQLGFDLMQRELRGEDTWLPLPHLGGMLLRSGFEAWCRQVAVHKGIELPARIDFPAWEAAGERRFREVSGLDLLRHHFSRLLEMFLVLDRAQWLSENGYQVQVAEFCPRECTPRNLLLQAWLQPNSPCRNQPPSCRSR